MKLRTLFSAQFKVLATMAGASCPVDEFLSDGPESTRVAREAIAQRLQHISIYGLHNVPTAWYKVANRESGIYEFKKGDVRVFFFRGSGGEVVICTCGVVKQGQKADPLAVKASIRAKNEYFEKPSRT